MSRRESRVVARSVIAMECAVLTMAVVALRSRDLPTTRRKKTSRAAQQSSLSSRVGSEVRSVVKS